jgi:hypothetical protein
MVTLSQLYGWRAGKATHTECSFTLLNNLTKPCKKFIYQHDRCGGGLT